MSDRDSIHNEPEPCDSHTGGDCDEAPYGFHLCLGAEGHTGWHYCCCGETWP